MIKKKTTSTELLENSMIVNKAFTQPNGCVTSFNIIIIISTAVVITIIILLLFL